MQTKKVVSFSLIACSLLFLAGCGTKTPDVSTNETPVVDTTVKTTDVNVKTTDATKEQCLELMAYAMKVAQLQSLWDTAAMTTWAQKANEIELQYKAKNLEYEQACNKYLADTKDMSFYNDVQKRIKELK